MKDPDQELNATRIPDSEKTNKDLKIREIREDYLPLIYELSDLQVMIAELEMTNSIKAARGLKKAVLIHIKRCKEFIRNLEAIRSEIDQELIKKRDKYNQSYVSKRESNTR